MKNNIQELFCASGLKCDECRFLIQTIMLDHSLKIEDTAFVKELEKHIRMIHPERAQALLDFKED